MWAFPIIEPKIKVKKTAKEGEKTLEKPHGSIVWWIELGSSKFRLYPRPMSPPPRLLGTPMGINRISCVEHVKYKSLWPFKGIKISVAFLISVQLYTLPIAVCHVFDFLFVFI